MSKKNALPNSAKTTTNKNDRENPSAMPGWPGYRTRKGRSGYDPIDMRTEAAHVSGSFIQQLFAGQLKINNPFYLSIAGVLGVGLLAPFILAIFEVLNGNLYSLNAWIPFLIAGVVGMALLFNFFKNLVRLVR